MPGKLRERSDRQCWVHGAVLSACVLVVLAFGLTQTTAHFDDAYITYRYARNLAGGRGFVYNPGQAVLGTTAPLYGLLLSLLNLTGVDIPQASHLLSVISWAVSALLLDRIGRAIRNEALGLLAAALVATCPLFLQVLGMETNLTIAVALGAVYLYLVNRTHLAFLLAALATWMRPDYALLTVILGAAYVWEHRALPWREGVIFVATLLPWLLFAQVFYGSVLPNSLYAKAGQGLKPLLGGTEFGTFGPGLMRLASDLYAVNKLYLLVVLFGFAGLVEALRSRPRWLIVVAWGVLYGISYILLAVIPFHWYYPPIWPSVALLTASGIIASARFLTHLKPHLHITSGGWAFLLSILVLIPQLDALWHSHMPNPTPYYRGYVAVAEWLRMNTPPEASVAMTEIGIIGYYSDRPVVDTMGIVSPAMVGKLHTWNQTVLYALTRYWPDYAVALVGTAWDALPQFRWFNEAYTPVAKIPSAGPGSRTVTIYKRSEGLPVRTFEFTHTYALTAGDTIGLSAIRMARTQLQPGTVLHAQIEWGALQHIDQDYEVLVDLVSAQDGRRWPLAAEQPMHGGNPTFLWQPGEVILDDYSLLLPPDLTKGAYLLEVRLQDVADNRLLTFAERQGGDVRHVTAGPLWVGPAIPPVYRISTPAPATFGQSIEFLGFDLPQLTFNAGEAVPLTLYWRATQPVDEDYTVFVHILDPAGNLIAQQDNPPMRGQLPTSLWVPGIIVQDDYQIVLPPDQPAGDYTVQIGLYRLETGERLPPRSSSGEVKDRALRIVHIRLR